MRCDGVQVFVFLTISKFGALNCALIGLGRKILSLLLSFVIYSHVLNASQMVGLALSLAAMIANFYEKVLWGGFLVPLVADCIPLYSCSSAGRKEARPRPRPWPREWEREGRGERRDSSAAVLPQRRGPGR